MEDFNSKYTGQQVEDLLDQVASGITEVYIADFTMESLRNGLRNGAQVDCRMQDLMTAMEANKVILVRESEDSAYKGVHVLNGYAEDLLYFSIVDTSGSILWCEGTALTDAYIDGRTLYLRSLDDKQDALKSGENIKTINGESILGRGNIEIGGGSSGGGKEVVYLEITPDIFGSEVLISELLPNKIYVVSDSIISLEISSFNTSDSHIDEYNIVFKSDQHCSLYLPSSEMLCWANGVIPEIFPSTSYELSIQRVDIMGTKMFNVVLTPFIYTES